ncbi:hypothetical protein HDU96_008945 [Phlyctochytrium bullatum]|nr:hypothetical protein HDU96_008945 [Phlyctochytrium bullatum]
MADDAQIKKDSQLLAGCSTCELADGMQKLGIGACYIVNAAPIVSPSSASVVVGRAHTVEFVPITDTITPPASAHHVDVLPAGHFMVIATPATAPNAVWGGLMANRAKVVGGVGVLVDGKVRDVAELEEVGLPVFATRGTSVLGAGGYVRPARVGEPVVLAKDSAWPVLVRPGDWIVADRDGAVRVPKERVEEVVAAALAVRDADTKCLEDILKGTTIVEAFKRHRGKK